VQVALDSLEIHGTYEKLCHGQYTQDVYVLGEHNGFKSGRHALIVAAMRRGGKGILLCDADHLEYMRYWNGQTRAKHSSVDL
jgi:hypothetical protein